MAATTSSGGIASIAPSSGAHLLQIDGYSIAKQAPNGTSLKSCPFIVGGYRWMLHLFPNGDCPENADFISIFLCPYRFDKDKQWRVSLQLEFSLIDEFEKQTPTHVGSRQVLEVIVNYAVGYRRFIAREALENSKHLKGDRFTVWCDIIITGYIAIPKNVLPERRTCVSCNSRSMMVAWLPLLHGCFCNVCNDASRNNPTVVQCAGCHGPYNGIGLLSPP